MADNKVDKILEHISEYVDKVSKNEKWFSNSKDVANKIFLGAAVLILFMALLVFITKDHLQSMSS